MAFIFTSSPLNVYSSKVDPQSKTPQRIYINCFFSYKSSRTKQTPVHIGNYLNWDLSLADDEEVNRDLWLCFVFLGVPILLIHLKGRDASNMVNTFLALQASPSYFACLFCFYCFGCIVSGALYLHLSWSLSNPTSSYQSKNCLSNWIHMVAAWRVTFLTAVSIYHL